MNKIYICCFIIFISESIFGQSLSVSFNGETLCKAKVEQVSFSSTGNFNQGNFFKIQLSDSSGNFTKPIEVAQFLNASFQNIAFVLPDSIYLGHKYRIRAVSTDPIIVSEDNGTNLSVIDTCKISASPIITLQELSSNLICTPTTASINWTITNGTFSNTNLLTIQLSDSSGSFLHPFNLAIASANALSQDLLIPADFTESSKYRIRVIATDSSAISNENDISIRSTPQPSIQIIPSNSCLGDDIKIIVSDSISNQSTFLWSGIGVGTNDTLKISQAGIKNVGNYIVHASNNGCTVSTSKQLVLSNCKPSWSWALADTFWTNTFNYPSTIIDSEIDSTNNLYIAGFFSQKMSLGNISINAIEGNSAFCDSTEKRTGFLAKITSDGQLVWYRKWNTLTETGDYQYCDLTIDNGQIFLVSEFNATSPCSNTPQNQASLVITNEEDFSLGSIAGYCRYAISDTTSTQYEYRYKGKFAWMAKFDLNGNLDILSNLTSLKTCSNSPTSFDTQATYGLGNKGYYSLKAKQGKLWLLYTWHQGLPNILKFINGNQYSNEAAGLVIAELKPSDLSIIKFEKMNVNSPNGALGFANLDIDSQNNVIITGSSATNGIGTALQVIFGSKKLNFRNAGYFVAKYNTSANSWSWAKKSQLIQVNTHATPAPNLKIDSKNNIYLGFSLKPTRFGSFAGLTFPSTSNGFDSTQTVALLKINSSGNAQWIKFNNHILQEGRNALGIDLQDNIYFTSYLNNSNSSEYFLIDNHRLQQKDLSTISNTSGTPFVAIYNPLGNLVGSVNNIKVYNAVLINGLSIDSSKNIIFIGQNFGKASFGEIHLNSDFSNQSYSLENSKRAFITKISSTQSIVLDSVSYRICAGEQAQIKFKTLGDFKNNTTFSVQLIGINGSQEGKIVEIANGNHSPISFTVPDSLAENTFYARVLTADNQIVGTFRTDNTLVVNSVPKPVILSNALGLISPQNVCSTNLSNFRIQGSGGPQGVLKYNGNTVYTGPNIDFQPTPQQSGIYTIHWTANGCTGISSDLVVNIHNKLSAQLTGNQVISATGSPAYLSLLVNGGGDYNVNISGLAPFNSDKSFQTIPVTPTQTTNYSIISISNACGNGTVTSSANISICPDLVQLQSPNDNYSSGTILKETNSSHGKIIANNIISNKAKVIFNSGREIILNPGFSTSDSVSFKAEIKGCKALTTATDPDFKLGYQVTYGTTDQIILEMTDFANKGANLFETTIRLEEVFKSLSQFNETNPDLLNQYWSRFDKIIRHANNIYDHIAIRIAVDYDDTRYYFQERDETDPNQNVYNTFDNALFDLFGGEIIQDQFGNPARIGYGSGHGSFASTSAKAKMKGFVQKVMDRYSPILGEKLYWVSIVTSAQFESGFNYENAWNGFNFTNPHACEFDYTFANVNQFRSWLVNERYAGLAGVNTAYGTSYVTQSQIQPPKVNVRTLEEMFSNDIRNMYNSVLFEDWYHFNYKQMKSFLVSCKELVKEKNASIKFCFEAGSNTDQLSSARKTFDIPDINTYAEVLKTTFQTSSFSGIKTWDADVVRSNFTGEIETEINEADVVTIGGITDPSIVKKKMLEYSKIAYLNQAKAIIFIAEKNTKFYNNSLDALAEFKTWIDNHTEQLTLGQTINVNLSQLIKNFSAALAPFNAIAPSLPTNGYQNRPKIIINPNN